jgi:hypothetical protein
MLLIGCDMSPTDLEIRQKLTGTWIADSDALSALEHKADGSFVLRHGDRVEAEGSWCVKGGFMIGTFTNANDAVQVGSNKVVSVGRHKLLILDNGGRTNELGYHRK